MKALWASATSRGDLSPGEDTGKALANIARTTLENVKEFEETGSQASRPFHDKLHMFCPADLGRMTGVW